MTRQRLAGIAVAQAVKTAAAIFMIMTMPGKTEGKTESAMKHWGSYVSTKNGAKVTALRLIDDDVRKLREFLGVHFALAPGDALVHYKDGSIRRFTKENFEKSYVREG